MSLWYMHINILIYCLVLVSSDKNNIANRASEMNAVCMIVKVCADVCAYRLRCRRNKAYGATVTEAARRREDGRSWRQIEEAGAWCMAAATCVGRGASVISL